MLEERAPGISITCGPFAGAIRGHHRSGTRTRRIFGQGLILVIPAAHMLSGWVAQTKPRVHIAGMELRATAIREGNFERVDLTFHSVDEQKLPIYLRMRRVPLCDNKPWPG